MAQMRLSALLACLVLFPWLALTQSTTSPPEKTGQTKSLNNALHLAAEHKYAEAQAAIRGIPPPAEVSQRILYFRLKAAIDEGLGNSKSAAANMYAAAKLAPTDTSLQLAAAVAKLQYELKSGLDPGTTLDSIRNMPVPSGRQLELRLKLAEMLVRSERFSDAVVDLEFAANLAPSNEEVFFNLSLAQLRLGQMDKALESAEKAKTLQDSASLESLLGEIQEKRGDFLAAARALQSAVALEPREESHRIALGVELLRHQNFDAAAVVFEQGITSFPESIKLRILTGISYYLLDRSKDAIQILEQSMKQDPKNEIAARYLGEVLLHDAQSTSMESTNGLCEIANRESANKTANIFCSVLRLKHAIEADDASDRAKILRSLEAAAAQSPQDATARCELGKGLEWAERWQEARVQMEKCVNLKPQSAEGHYRLARIYRKLGLNALAAKQGELQKAAVKQEASESDERVRNVEKFLIYMDQSRPGVSQDHNSVNPPR